MDACRANWRNNPRACFITVNGCFVDAKPSVFTGAGFVIHSKGSAPHPFLPELARQNSIQCKSGTGKLVQRLDLLRFKCAIALKSEGRPHWPSARTRTALATADSTKRANSSIMPDQDGRPDHIDMPDPMSRTVSSCARTCFSFSISQIR